MQVTVFGRATSSNVQAVMWGAAELGLDVKRIDVGHVHGGNDTPEFLAMNPHGLVPVLKDGALDMFESCAILRYLAAEYRQNNTFWPADARKRAVIDSWAEWGKTTYAREFTAPIFWLRVRTSAADRNEVILAGNIAKFEGFLDRLEAQLGSSNFVCGTNFTLADIVIGHVLFRWFNIDIPRRVRPVVEDYYARLCDRPAYRTHVCVDYGILQDPDA